MTRVAILWHMHQPLYEDLATHEHILPWVRLHALKDYWGMVALLREFPDVKVTFNLVPSLLVQLESFAAGRARDRHLELSLKAADALTDGDVEFVLENFFHAHRDRMINTHPRYAALLAQRGGPLAAATAAERRAVARRFSAGDLRDLQVWHKLAWLDPIYLERDPRVLRLVDQGRDFEEPDKWVLREVELELLNQVIPEYRNAAARGQIEIATSPFYHPILPLLCDTDVYRRTHPDSPMPRQRFVHPEDAADQLARAADYHERLFGRRPVGLWPSEGSVSDAMVPLAAAAGFTWMATDELILARTLNLTFSRDGDGHVEQPERLYAAYSVGTAPARIACLFRDHVLSDLIGFTYAGWAPEVAADDFVGRLVEGGRRYRARTNGGEALIPIILDGENAWEHFEGGGRPFLRALYSRLSAHAELRTVTIAEGCASPHERIASVFPGSWIDGNFYIWIGHADDQRAWNQLADARRALDAADVPEAARAAAREEVLIAEGSDWFWWYGDDHSSDHDVEFDDLFRRHLRNAYGLLGTRIPEELFRSNISTDRATPAQTAPTGILSPTIDGEETSYFEWLTAGTFEVQDAAGAMHPTTRQPPMIALVHFGFGLHQFYLRVDGKRRMAEILRDGYRLTLTFVHPARVITVRQAGHRLSADADAAAGAVLELAVPLTDIGAGPGDLVSFFVSVNDAAGSEVERHPWSRPIEVIVPDGQFAARNWSV